MTAIGSASAKLGIDFYDIVALLGTMDDQDKLALRLLTLAGAIMEDGSMVAIIGRGGLELNHRASAVASAASDAQLLAQAAVIVLRR